MEPIIIGLAGLRRVGKSRIADHLVANHGFEKIHPFDGGKAACRAYYTHLGISESDARRMTDGDLKDIPCDRLPEGQTSRFFMEKFGKFMGVEMGPDWTIGRELIRASENGQGRLLVESLVYEDTVVRQRGGHVWKVIRPGREPVPGLETDRYTMNMVADREILNDKATLEELYRDVDAFVEEALAALAEPEYMGP